VAEYSWNTETDMPTFGFSAIEQIPLHSNTNTANPSNSNRNVATQFEQNFDLVGKYEQDKINGFSRETVDKMIELADIRPEHAVLDAMGGNGNLALRICGYFKEKNEQPPHELVVLEYSRVQAKFAEYTLAAHAADVLWGDILTLQSRETGEPLPEERFDRILIKSANHEIPLHRQRELYTNIHRLLKPGGIFINLGFLFDDAVERDEFIQVTRAKDSLAGMQMLVENRYFLLKDELYSLLNDSGFAEPRCGHSLHYTIQSKMAAEQYFDGDEDRHFQLQAAQAMARTLRRKRRIEFKEDWTVMRIPGEITVAQKPDNATRNTMIYNDYPYDFLRHIEAHQKLLGGATKFIPAHCKLLDVGCGLGLLAEHLVDKPCEYYGIDLNPVFIEACQNRFRGHDSFCFEVADLADAQFGIERYDVVCLINVIYQQGIDVPELIQKTRYALKPGGRLIISGPSSRESFEHAEPQMIAQLERDGFLPAYSDLFEMIREANRRLLVQKGNYYSLEGAAQLLLALGMKPQYADGSIYYGQGYLIVATR
jgi:SAM-dependent methyltransferase